MTRQGGAAIDRGVETEAQRKDGTGFVHRGKLAREGELLQSKDVTGPEIELNDGIKAD